MSTQLLPFKLSKHCTVGIELELQIINPYTFNLIGRAEEILKKIQQTQHPGVIKPEFMRSMIEINTSIHDTSTALFDELLEIKSCFIELAVELGVRFSGGGTHPFQLWQDNKIFPMLRYQKLSKLYGYLANQITIFGQHVHIGCANAEDAIYLTHVFNRYLPHFIALSAASPYYQAVDTAYNSVRVNIHTTFPTSGFMPLINTWKEFSCYFHKMASFNIVETMKDIYWDVRPKPEFGTVELRICDTPLTIEKAVMLAAYAQTLAHYILEKRPYKVSDKIYMLYQVNRFQASRFGFDGDFINPMTEKTMKVSEDILQTLPLIASHGEVLNNSKFLEQVSSNTIAKQNDARWLRKTFAKVNSFAELVHEQSKLWMGD